MRDLPNPSLIDNELSLPPIEKADPSWGLIILVSVLFVAFILFCGFLDVRMQFS